jgi:hypothetical protein
VGHRMDMVVLVEEVDLVLKDLVRPGLFAHAHLLAYPVLFLFLTRLPHLLLLHNLLCVDLVSIFV